MCCSKRSWKLSPFVTELSCARGSDVTRKAKNDFKGGWFSLPLVDRYVALSNYYFSEALIPATSPDGVKPACEVLAEDWATANQKKDDDKDAYDDETVRQRS